MIVRTLLAFLCMFFVSVIELSFLSRLPAPLNFIPLMFLTGVLLLHSVRPSVGFFWMVFGGIILDLFGFTSFQHTVAYTLAGLSGVFLAQRVFTIKSTYAMLGLGICMNLVLLLVQSIWFVSESALAGVSIEQGVILHFVGWQLFVTIVGLALLYVVGHRFAERLRGVFFVRAFQKTSV